MKTNRIRWTVAGMGLAMLADVLVVGRLRAAELPEDARAALESNAAKLPPIQLAWTQSVESPHARDELQSRFGMSSSGLMYPALVQLSWQPDRWYVFSELWMTGFDRGARKVLASEISFDGHSVFSGSGKKAALLAEEDAVPSLIIEPLDKVLPGRSEHLVFDSGYLTAAGYWVPSRYGELKRSMNSRILKLLGESPAELRSVSGEEVEGQSVLRLEIALPEFTYRFWLLPETGFAVLRWEELSPQGKLREAGENSDFQPLSEKSVSLPQICRVTQFYWPDSPGDVHDVAVIDRIFRLTSSGAKLLPEEAFALNYDEAGSTIADARPAEADKLSNGRVTYVVPADREDLDEVIDAARRGERLSPRLDPIPRRQWGWWLLAINVIFLLCIGWMMRRKWKS